MTTIGLIMGDAGGIGPELVIKLLSQPWIHDRCRAVVIGDAGVLGELWTTCVTLHMPFREVADLITPDSVLEAILALDRALAGARADSRSVAVRALKPHAGAGGVLGREEIDSIAPAVAEARPAGVDARGPFAADTLFPRALGERMG